MRGRGLMGIMGPPLSLARDAIPLMNGLNLFLKNYKFLLKKNKVFVVLIKNLINNEA
jgi:hypothetical protein